MAVLPPECVTCGWFTTMSRAILSSGIWFVNTWSIGPHIACYCLLDDLRNTPWGAAWLFVFGGCTNTFFILMKNEWHHAVSEVCVRCLRQWLGMNCWLVLLLSTPQSPAVGARWPLVAPSGQSRLCDCRWGRTDGLGTQIRCAKSWSCRSELSFSYLFWEEVTSNMTFLALVAIKL